VFGFDTPQYVSCADCGAVLPQSEQDAHVCDRDRWLEHQLGRMRPEIQRFFTQDLPLWLSSNEGRFEVYWAARQRRAA
jgi:hypothetical protein